MNVGSDPGGLSIGGNVNVSGEPDGTNISYTSGGSGSDAKDGVLATPDTPCTDAGGAGKKPPNVPITASAAGSFWDRVEQAIQEELAARGDIYSDAHSLTDLSSPHQVANPDPSLGQNQVRYQATVINEVTGETTDWSVNYDSDSGKFGTIKPASGK
jgi:hypothetical protein